MAHIIISLDNNDFDEIKVLFEALSELGYTPSSEEFASAMQQAKADFKTEEELEFYKAEAELQKAQDASYEARRKLFAIRTQLPLSLRSTSVEELEQQLQQIREAEVEKSQQLETACKAYATDYLCAPYCGRPQCYIDKLNFSWELFHEYDPLNILKLDQELQRLREAEVEKSRQLEVAKQRDVAEERLQKAMTEESRLLERFNRIYG